MGCVKGFCVFAYVYVLIRFLYLRLVRVAGEMHRHCERSDDSGRWYIRDAQRYTRKLRLRQCVREHCIQNVRVQHRDNARECAK